MHFVIIAPPLHADHCYNMLQRTGAARSLLEGTRVSLPSVEKSHAQLETK
jgi:hypothetical protein